jgi:hypothetical protein
MLGTTQPRPAVSRPSAQWPIRRTMKLSQHLAITIAMSPVGALAHWHGTPPERLSPSQWRRYRKGRSQLARELGECMGDIDVVIVHPSFDGALLGIAVGANP